MKYLIIIFLSLLTPSLSLAEPSDITKYLITEPVSLMDVALHKLRSDLSTYSPLRDKRVWPSVTYSWEKDLIIIEFRRDVTRELEKLKKHSSSYFKTTCKETIAIANMRLFMTCYDSFSHEGYKSTSESSNFKEDLFKKILVKAIIYKHTDETPFSLFCRCESMLSEDRVLYEGD